MAGRTWPHLPVSPARWKAQECRGRRVGEDAHLGLSGGTGGPVRRELRVGQQKGQ